jgi:hypothetical protein
MFALTDAGLPGVAPDGPAPETAGSAGDDVMPEGGQGPSPFVWQQTPEWAWPKQRPSKILRLGRLLRKWQRLALSTPATIWSILRMRFGRSPVWWSGFALIALGIGALIGSRLLVSGSQAPVTGWWQGTLQALGIGLIVGGLVDVLAITGLNRVMVQRQRINDSWRRMLYSEGQHQDRAAYEKAVDDFVSKNWRQEQYLDPDVYSALLASGALPRVWEDAIQQRVHWKPGNPKPRGPSLDEMMRSIDSRRPRRRARHLDGQK